jgi:DNA-binding response OmpR family regulator
MAFVVAALRTTETRQMVNAFLESERHTSAIFGAGGAAVTEALAGAPDLLIIETQLTDMNVMQICDAVHGHPSTAAIPIVVCGPPDVHLSRLLGSADRRVFHAAPPSCLRETVAAALTMPVGHSSPSGAISGPTPPDADVARPAQPERPALRVLLVEDDVSIAEPLIDGLTRYGFLVNWVSTGAAALKAPPAAMVLLDLGLPDIDGLEVCRRLCHTGDTSVIMLTARGDECDRVVGLELGADDYLAKPFGLRELVARMRAVSRRTRPTPAVATQP